MSDSFASAWALGSIAGELSAQRNAQTTQYFVDAMKRRRQRQQQDQQVQIDVNSLIDMVAERDEMIADLEARLLDLQMRANLVEANRDKINAWAIWAEQKLKSVGAI